MHKNKIENILKLNNTDRCNYSIREIVKLKHVWAISTQDSWVTFVDTSGDEIFPIWPHKEVAELCVFEELKVDNYFLKAIDLDKFIAYCIPEMRELDILFGVFYNQNKEAIVLKPDILRNELENEENNY